MLRHIFRYITLLLLLAGSSLSGAEGWASLKLGMTADEAAEVLGNPLIKTAGNGFEMWIYDNHAEVLFYGGPLIGWTTPTWEKVAGRAVDVWQKKPGSAASPVFILPRPSQRNARANRQRDENTETPYRVPLYRLPN